MIWLAVALAGAAGATTRYLVDLNVNLRFRIGIPLGSTVVNLTGSYLAGVVAGLTATLVLSDRLAVVVAGGFLGAYTTFSTAMYETVRLLEAGQPGRAVANLTLPLLGAVIAAAAGWASAIALT